MVRVPIYVYFSQGWDGLDYSDESLIECFEWDSSGGEIKNPMNGYVIGKKWMDVTVKMWREDIRKGLLYKYELYEDPELEPFKEWVKEQVDDVHQGCGWFED